MVKRLSALFVMVALFAPFAMSQELQTVFWTDHNDDGSVLPILIKKGRTLDAEGTEVGSWLDGTRTQDRYMGLRRYDDERLLLGVLANGINENDPEDNQALAAQYPDRSLIWISEADGRPMGVALNIGVTPVTPTEAYTTAYGASISFFMAFDVSDDGYVYVAFGEYILRYAPDGANGFTGPEIVFQLDVEQYGPEDWGISAFEVTGSGPSTQINGGQNGTGFLIETTDGNNFELTQTYSRTGWPPLGGCQSQIIRGPEGGFDEWIFSSGYGNNSAGNDSSFYRLYRPIDSPGDVFADDSEFFSAQGMPDAGDLDYRANYIGDVGGADGLPYIVAYSTPSWDSSVKTSPGFLALHDVSASALTGEMDGAYISSLQLDVYTTEELRLPTVTTSSWYGTEGVVEVNIPSTAAPGASEVLLCGGIYGYGRFTVGDTDVNDWSIY